MRRRWKPGYLLAAVGVIAGRPAHGPGAGRADTFTDTGFAAETVATVPPFTLVGLTFAPDGRLFVWQKNGVVRIIKNGLLLPTPFIDLSAKVNTFDDRGFWGLAFDPDFASNGYVYMSYTFENAGNPNSNAPRDRTADPRHGQPGQPRRRPAGQRDGHPRQHRHAAVQRPARRRRLHRVRRRQPHHRHLHFADDGTLFVGVGDGADGDADSSLRAQDLNSSNGKILRINKDGTAPADNPFYDGTNSIRSKVWLYGVRNPFRFDVPPGHRRDLLRRRRLEHLGRGQSRRRGRQLRVAVLRGQRAAAVLPEPLPRPAAAR